MGKPTTFKEAVAYLYASMDLANRTRSWDAGALELMDTEYDLLLQKVRDLESVREPEMWEGYTDEDLEEQYERAMEIRDWFTCDVINAELDRRRNPVGY